jgi:hypothetical protein
MPVLPCRCWAEIKHTTGAMHGDLVGAIKDRVLIPTGYSPLPAHLA